MPQRIAVLGAGTMGAGIAQLAAQAGHDVLLYDINDDFVQRGHQTIGKALQSRVDPQRSGESRPRRRGTTLQLMTYWSRLRLRTWT
jgi:3-hydroxybutyryl-CoA dehydrogenase